MISKMLMDPDVCKRLIVKNNIKMRKMQVAIKSSKAVQPENITVDSAKIGFDCVRGQGFPGSLIMMWGMVIALGSCGEGL